MSAAASGTRVRAPTDFWWSRVRREAETLAHHEPALAALVLSSILGQPSIEMALCHRLAGRLGSAVPAEALRTVFADIVSHDDELRRCMRLDLVAVMDRDPASASPLGAILNFKGFHAITAHRVAHALWHRGRRDLALYIHHGVCETLQVSIHPAVPTGAGLFIDHATGVSIGRTAVIGDNVSILQGVVLGADPEAGRDARHPRIGHSVMIGAGARLIGNIEIGHCSRIGAGSLVTRSVPANTTVAGVPARVIGPAGCPEPARTMDQIVFDVGL